MKELHFQSSVSGDRSPSVKYFGEHHELRRSLQQLAVQGVTGEEAAHKAADYAVFPVIPIQVFASARAISNRSANTHSSMDWWTSGSASFWS